MNKAFEESLSDLEAVTPEIRKYTFGALMANKGNLFAMDLLTVTVSHRALCLISGFCLMIRNENFICAASLVRLLLDNLLRYSAAWIVDDSDEFALSVIAGKRVKDITDTEGKQMTDRYLVKKMATKFPWVESVYKETSGYIHLSDKHFHNTIKNIEGNHIEFGAATSDIAVPDSIYLECIDGMTEISIALLNYVKGWMRSKGTFNICNISDSLIKDD